MTQDEFLKYLRIAKNIISEAAPYKHKMGLGNFLNYFDKYKDEVFFDFPQDLRDSSSFRAFVNEVMGMVLYYEALENDELPQYTLTNIVNFNEYREKRMLYGST